MTIVSTSPQASEAEIPDAGFFSFYHLPTNNT